MNVIADIKDPTHVPLNDGARTDRGIKLFDLDVLCPIELVRTHTKTDDVPFVTDDQLRMYRKVAFEQAQEYSAILCGPVQQIVEHVRYKMPRATFRHPYQFVTHETQFPVHAPYVYVWGGVSRQNKPIKVREGQRRIKVESYAPDMFFSDCCDACAPGSDTEQPIMYYAGYKCEADIPSGICLGMLKFIAWSVMRPGDELLTQRNRTSIAEAGVTGTNNAAWASGALELWVAYDDLRY